MVPAEGRAAAIGVLGLLLCGQAFAAKPPPVTLECSIDSVSPSSTIGVGETLTVTGTATGGTPDYRFDWAFGDGTTAQETTGGDSNVDHAYASAGSYTISMQATETKRGKKANCATVPTVTITVQGGQPPVNTPPVADDDAYGTPQDTSLIVPAPGVLGNDSDADGDSLTAVKQTDPGNGNLTLNPDGSFTYVPNPGFSGADGFTYVANDGTDDSNVATVSIDVEGAPPPLPDVSINSTSQDGFNATPVSEQPAPGEPGSGQGNYTVLAINDLGMHCGDLDTRISSILPPFQVVHSQVIQRGSRPDLLSSADGIEVYYSAASNPLDPALSGLGPSGEPLLSSLVNGSVYKTNFWDIARGAYDPFYPQGILPAFYDPALNIADLGLPVPNVERLYLEDGELEAIQQSMPSEDFRDPTHGGPLSDRSTAPYLANEPQLFQEFIGDLPFFTNPDFQFGYVAEGVNWFEAAGIPLAAFDDFGLENPYPLMRVQARDAGGTVLASVDTVTPIAGEANCQGCHGAPGDGGNGAAIADLAVVTASIEDPQHGAVPNEVSIEWASDLNILRLHDQKHSTDLLSETPVVCQTCHYTPALDLAQLGPLGPENDGPLVLNGVEISPSLANGRDQVKHKSMSNVMHSHHGLVDVNGQSPGEPGYDGDNLLFPTMPPAVDGDGNFRNPVLAQGLLEETCY